jgi:D-alanyl-D-alanine carboxypeptidase/D-alanyl-D-alanine-endopeptidase (penicillin-binding protein 4)
LKGNVHAKTGTIRYVNTISGYVRTLANEQLAFSVMLNAYSSSLGNPSSRDEVDQAVRWASELTEKTSTASPEQPVGKKD